ncbi:MAG: SPFH domain-containing protein, partial [Caldilineaceae bacterium]
AGFWDRFRSGPRDEDITILLIDSGEISLDFALSDLWTMDPLRLNADCRIAVQADDPVRFYHNVVKDSPTYTERDLRARIYPELESAAQAYTAEHSIEQLDQGAAQRNEDFAVDVAERLRQLFAQTGLTFQRVQFFDLRHPRVDELKQVEEDLFLGPVKLEHQRRLFDLYTQEQVLDIAKEEHEAAHFVKRAQVWQAMRKAVVEDRINQRTTDDEWDAFVAEADKEKLLRDHELAAFRDQLAWEEQDTQKARAHLVAMADLQSQYELDAARLTFIYKNKKQQLDEALALARAGALGQLELRADVVEAEMKADELERKRDAARNEGRRSEEMKQLEHDLTQAQAAADFLRQKERDDAELRRALLRGDHDLSQEMRLGDAKITADIRELERDEDRKDAELALSMLAQMKQVRRADLAAGQAIERKHDEESRRIAREDELTRQEAALAAKEHEERLAMEREAQTQAHELERMRLMGTLSTEALIALSPTDQAKILAEIKRTEQFKDFSEDKILALASERNPELAQVLIKKQELATEGKLKAAEADMWQKLADERVKAQEALRDQMQAQMDAQTERSAAQNEQIERMAKEAAERQERISSAAMDNMADVAKTVAQRPEQSGTTVVYPPGGSAPSVGPMTTGPVPTGPISTGGGSVAASGGEVQVCPNCRASRRWARSSATTADISFSVRRQQQRIQKGTNFTRLPSV